MPRPGPLSARAGTTRGTGFGGFPSPSGASAPAEALRELATPLGVLAALLLPFFVYTSLSDHALRESKLIAQAFGVSLAFAGLAGARRSGSGPEEGRPADAPGQRVLALVVKACLFSSLALVAASGIANRGQWVDPLTFVALLSLLGLFLAGASGPAALFAPRTLQVLSWAGVVTGALAFGQRFLDFPRLPVEPKEPRFFATALLSNPGDVAAALVPPALLLWTAFSRPDRLRARGLRAAALFTVLMGLGATESIAPLLAVGFGILLHTLLDLRRRASTFIVVTVLLGAAMGITGAGERALGKLREFREGKIGAALTQRDIGVLAAFEMIRANPFLGIGPGNYENAFVPYRLAAEERYRRRLVHKSEEAHFQDAHSEPLTLAAECGLPVALAASGLALAVLAGLFLLHRRERLEDLAPDPPADTLLVLLASFLVLSLGGFPLRLPIVAGPTAFVAGLAWRRLGIRGVAPTSLSGRAGRVSLSVAGALLLALAVLRGLATYWQAEGEAELQAAALATGNARSWLLGQARDDLSRAVRLRPRRATAWLALGSAYRLDGNAENAWRCTLMSHTLEERAETDLNLGLLALGRGAREDAHVLFRRAVWIQPRLIAAVPDEANPDYVQLEVTEFEANLARGGPAPSLFTTRGGLLLMVE